MDLEYKIGISILSTVGALEVLLPLGIVLTSASEMAMKNKVKNFRTGLKFCWDVISKYDIGALFSDSDERDYKAKKGMLDILKKHNHVGAYQFEKALHSQASYFNDEK